MNARIAYEGFVALPDRGDAELPFADEGSPDAVVTCRSDGTIHLAEGGRTVLLGDRWHPVWAANGNGRWYRTARNESGALVVVRSAMWQTRVEGSPEVVERARRMEREIGPFLGDGMGSLYRSGIFGRRLIDGGSGDAERILLEAAEIVVRTMWGPLDVRGRSVGVLSRTAVPQPELRTVAAW
ncbi:hypothetical protein [Rathayibacter sp. VKM Ac-2878]|uniref:hypothetical protein n=1 Tax=Rathayibacter sp. VKM Ac-2878 TaxID=2783831 RepID=UPI001E299935|nr:hypothetical protein [Rathayibacter sp. VKM Ac-2878]